MSRCRRDLRTANPGAGPPIVPPEALPFELGQRVVIRPTGEPVVIAGIRKSPIEGWIFTVEGDGIRYDLRESYLAADIGR